MVCCRLLAARSAPPGALAATPYDAAIRTAARRHFPAAWDWRILKAMVYQESRFDPEARSAAGALGLCQIMPATAGDLGLRPEQLLQPALNLDAGARLLRRHWDAVRGPDDAPPRWDRSRAAVAAYQC